MPGGGKDTAEAGDSKRDENYEQDVGKKDQRQEQWKNDEQNTNHEKKRRWVEDEDKKAKEVPINNFNEANELLNNDQKFDDQELAVQEGRVLSLKVETYSTPLCPVPERRLLKLVYNTYLKNTMAVDEMAFLQ